jgi:hypothetical protein
MTRGLLHAIAPLVGTGGLVLGEMGQASLGDLQGEDVDAAGYLAER